MPYHNNTTIIKPTHDDKDAVINDARRIKTQEDFFIAKVRKGCSRFPWERELETEHNWNILTPKLWPSALCLSCSPWLLNWSPGNHCPGCWLSLQNLVHLPLQLIKFLFPCPLVCKPLRKHALPDQTHAGFLFNLIRNPRGYQYIGTSPFPDSFRFTKSHTNPKHHRDWKIQTSSTKY